VGRRADLLLLDANPLADVKNVSNWSWSVLRAPLGMRPTLALQKHGVKPKGHDKAKSRAQLNFRLKPPVCTARYTMPTAVHKAPTRMANDEMLNQM